MQKKIIWNWTKQLFEIKWNLMFAADDNNDDNGHLIDVIRNKFIVLIKIKLLGIILPILFCAQNQS